MYDALAAHQFSAFRFEVLFDYADSCGLKIMPNLLHSTSLDFLHNGVADYRVYDFLHRVHFFAWPIVLSVGPDRRNVGVCNRVVSVYLPDDNLGLNTKILL